MHRHYLDILNRISDPVLWFDECAVPRFDPFTPQMVANIYAVEAALVRIECQGCMRPFDVAFTGVMASWALPDDTVLDGKHPMIRDHIRAHTLHYGDPPNVDCCGSGATMNSVPRRVLEYWVQPYALGEGVSEDPEFPGWRIITDPSATHFRREPAFEIDIAPDWWAG